MIPSKKEWMDALATRHGKKLQKNAGCKLTAAQQDSAHFVGMLGMLVTAATAAAAFVMMFVLVMAAARMVVMFLVAAAFVMLLPVSAMAAVMVTVIVLVMHNIASEYIDI